MSLPSILALVFIAVVFIVLSISRWKWHPVFSLLVASIGLGLAFRMEPNEVVNQLGNGFGGILAGIGLIVVLGSIIGVALERSGAAVQIAEFVLRLFGPKRPGLAMAVIGAIVSIPVFCDSGFILLSGLNRSLAQRTGRAIGVLSLALAAGLYTTHTLVPPTPGPIAAASYLGADAYLGLIMLLGGLVTLPVLFIAYRLSLALGKTITIDEAKLEEDLGHAGAMSTTAVMSNPPSVGLSFAPLLLPIALIAIGTIIDFNNWTGGLASVMAFLGKPLIALLAGCIPAYLLARTTQSDWKAWCTQGVKMSGPILIITGAGGAFGRILSNSGLREAIETSLAGGQLSYFLLLILAFLVAALLKTAQGSSTNALVITAGMLGPLAAAAGVVAPAEFALLVLAIGGGAMTVSHANDSYFWVVTRFSGIPVGQAYRTYTLITAIMGLTTLATVLLLSVLLT